MIVRLQRPDCCFGVFIDWNLKKSDNVWEFIYTISIQYFLYIYTHAYIYISIYVYIIEPNRHVQLLTPKPMKRIYAPNVRTQRRWYAKELHRARGYGSNMATEDGYGGIELAKGIKSHQITGWWGFSKKYFLFSPRKLGKWSNLTNIFSNGLKPPTR